MTNERKNALKIYLDGYIIEDITHIKIYFIVQYDKMRKKTH